jgi:hypothetical protein
VVKGHHLAQISIHLEFLVPWELKGSGNMVVIDSFWFGIAGVIVGQEKESYTVRFTPVEESLEEHFETFEAR